MMVGAAWFSTIPRNCRHPAALAFIGFDWTMAFQVTGKNVDVGEALQSYIVNRLGDDIAKYFGGEASGHVTLSREGKAFRTDCTIHLSSGISLQTRGQSKDAYASFDRAGDKLEKRLRRYMRRLKEHHHRQSAPVASEDVQSYVLAPGEDDDAAETALNPVIVAETKAKIRELTVGEAVMQLDLSDDVFLFFRNVGHNGLNVVYRRSDGNFGWIDPEGAKGGIEPDSS